MQILKKRTQREILARLRDAGVIDGIGYTTAIAKEDKKDATSAKARATRAITQQQKQLTYLCAIGEISVDEYMKRWSELREGVKEN